MHSNILDNVKALIIDMDGVLWHDTEPLGDLPMIFVHIRSKGYVFLLLTNNATRTVQEYYNKLHGFGVTLNKGQIINSAEAAGIYLSEKYPHGCSSYVVGQPSLKQTLMDHGIRIAEDEEEDVDVVIASLDFNLNYEKLRRASTLIQKGCEFIGTNPDNTLPTPNGFIPGSGTIIGALEIASGRKAKIIGKPQPLLYEMALRRLNVLPEETLAIGDRLETDIAGAQAANIRTALVLSGVSTLEQAKQYLPQPDLIAKNLTELLFK